MVSVSLVDDLMEAVSAESVAALMQDQRWSEFKGLLAFLLSVHVDLSKFIKRFDCVEGGLTVVAKQNVIHY